MATHSSIYTWEIPGTEEPGELQSMGSDTATLTQHLLIQWNDQVSVSSSVLSCHNKDLE